METIYIPSQEGRTSTQDTYRGIRKTFSSPYHFYIRVADLSKPTVRFIVYSMGKEKVIASGIYSFRDGTFRLTYSCDYKTAKRLVDYLELMRDDYINALNIVKNRIDKRIADYLGRAQGTDYLQLKLWLTFQPESVFFTNQAVEDRRRRLDPAFVKKMERSPFYQNLLQLDHELEEADLMLDMDRAYELYQQREDLRMREIAHLDQEVEMAERALNMKHHLTADRTIIDISERFYDWISTVGHSLLETSPPCDDVSASLLFGEDLT